MQGFALKFTYSAYVYLVSVFNFVGVLSQTVLEPLIKTDPRANMVITAINQKSLSIKLNLF